MVSFLFGHSTYAAFLLKKFKNLFPLCSVFCAVVVGAVADGFAFSF